MTAIDREKVSTDFHDAAVVREIVRKAKRITYADAYSLTNGRLSRADFQTTVRTLVDAKLIREGDHLVWIGGF